MLRHAALGRLEISFLLFYLRLPGTYGCFTDLR